MLTTLYGCLSDRGQTHAGNEDRWFTDQLVGLYIVSDGMSHEAPAQLVVDQLPGLIRRSVPEDIDIASDAAAQAVQSAVRDVSDLVRAAGQAGPEGEIWQGLGATIALAIVRSPWALLAHLGDSRIYLIRGGRLEAMTRDHSWLEEWVNEGKIAQEEARLCAFNGGPTRFAGMDKPAQADTRLLHLQDGDRILLCSDGLTCMLHDEEIEAILNKQPDPSEACRSLVAAANAAGGDDNITALIVAIEH
jgi:protein phosphatase